MFERLDKIEERYHELGQQIASPELVSNLERLQKLAQERAGIEDLVMDILAEKCEVIARYNGGANAGHTVVVGDAKFALHLLPSGAVRPGLTCMICSGVVVDPQTLLEEIDGLAEAGITLDGRLFISEGAHLVMDYHKLEDKLREAAASGARLGTTARGIGPCYADKAGRTHAVRVCELADLETLEEKLAKIIEHKNRVFSAAYGAEAMDPGVIFEKCRRYAEMLVPFMADTTSMLHEALAAGRSILFEGAQGSLLDIDHGSFPFVTSSSSCALGLGAGSGVPPKNIDEFLGVAKAYTTRVGAGPFPTEQDNPTGDYIREKGHEFGTTTGRPRRCGWFDAVAVGYSARIGGIDSMALMHLDTLSGLEELRICTAYRLADGREGPFFPTSSVKLASVQCVYESLAGWDGDLRGCRRFEQLPESARRYIERVESLCKIPVKMVSVGPKRSQIIFR